MPILHTPGKGICTCLAFQNLHILKPQPAGNECGNDVNWEELMKASQVFSFFRLYKIMEYEEDLTMENF